MIKLVGTLADGHKGIVLGITEKNVQLLKQKHPIQILGAEVGCDHDIYIIYEKTDKALLETLAEAGIKLPEPHGEA